MKSNAWHRPRKGNHSEISIIPSLMVLKIGQIVGINGAAGRPESRGKMKFGQVLITGVLARICLWFASEIGMGISRREILDHLSFCTKLSTQYSS